MIENVQLRQRQLEGATLIEVCGFLDNSNVPQFEREIFKLLAGGPSRVILDLNRLEYICSAGLAVLLTLQDRLRQNRGEVVLSRLPPKIEHLFHTLGFQELFRIHHNEQEALRDFHTVRA